MVVSTGFQLTLVATLCIAGCATGGADEASFAKLPANDIARQALSANDGWAADGSGTSGGAAAHAGDIYTVSTRKQFVDALKRSGNSAKIIRVQGTINLSSDDSGRELFAKDYADPAYDFEAYKKAYDPNTWNRQALVGGKPPTAHGPLQDAQRRSYLKQHNVIQVLIPSNTTIIGIGADAKIVKGTLYLDKGVDNVIIRNIAFEDAFDYFPWWNAGDSYSTSPNSIGCQDTFVDDTHGPHRCNGGRWNSEYDNISLKGAAHVWIDHCSFSDGERLDKLFPPNYAAPYNQPEQKIAHHDGLLDITNESNFVTVSNNHFFNHDKSLLVGGGDNQPLDAGKLKVTFHHNVFENLRQRQPLIRYGQVHSYNNLFIGARSGPPYTFSYVFGLGTSTRLYAENNVFELGDGIAPADLLYYYNYSNTAAMVDKGSLINGKPVDIVKTFNASKPQKISEDVGWTPTLVSKLMPSGDVSAYVKANAGAGKL
jgi:pectate lyase